MIKLENITKTYKNNKTNQEVLKNITLIFRDKEFVSILGPSGSGKTTLLNIIGTLDTDYQGTYYISNKQISNQKRIVYNFLRNKIIGFVFQDYNLIEHLTVYKNVELALCLRKTQNKREKVFKVLDEVGLLEYSNKKVSKLSGGQKQRVAIARAIVNNPKIILMDEPTGALDQSLSYQIMDLIKRISKDKLVIMVTHDKDLAEKYSSRIININNGKIINDSNKCSNYDYKELTPPEEKISFTKKTSFKLALNNLKVKIFRNLLTIIAFTISLIGISLVLSISEGVTYQVEELKEETLSNYPIVIQNERQIEKKESKNYDENKIYSHQKTIEEKINFPNEYLSYISNIKNKEKIGIVNHYEYSFNILTKSNDEIMLSEPNSFTPIPINNNYLEKNYQILSGKLPTNENEIIIKVDNNNLNENIFKLFGINQKSINLNDLIGKKLKIVLNNTLYQKIENRYYYNEINDKMYNNKNNITLTVVGIVKVNDDMEFNSLINEEVGSIYYKESLTKRILNLNNNSDIVKYQKQKNYNVLTGKTITKNERKTLLNYLGINQKPYMIYLYPETKEVKEYIITYLDKYNKNNKEIKYIDLSEDVIKITKNLVFGITSILFIFSLISLIITLILIMIITYTSILERKKEIGILKSIGTRKKDIKKLFITETIIISIISSVIGITILKISAIPLNKLLYDLTELENIIRLSPKTISIVLLIGIVTSITGSFIPARNASKLDPVKCLK